MDVFNAVVAAGFSLALAFAIMSPKVRDGVIIKAGLIALSIGFAGISFMSLSHAWWAIPRALALLHLGALLILLGYWARTRKTGHPLRRSTDFGSLDEAPAKR